MEWLHTRVLPPLTSSLLSFQDTFAKQNVTIPAKHPKFDEIFLREVLHLVKLSPAIAATIEQHEAESTVSTRTAQIQCSPVPGVSVQLPHTMRWWIPLSQFLPVPRVISLITASKDKAVTPNQE